MHLLLPPSEAKTSGGRGRPLRQRMNGAGATAPLWGCRRIAVNALMTLLDADPDAAARALRLPDSIAGAALRANGELLDSPTTPALRRYSGIVYEGLAFESLSASQQRVALRCTLVFSGLWGILRGDEPTPEYRVPAKATLPGVGVMSTFWRSRLDAVVPGLVHRGLIVDLRSTDYAAMWRPDRDVAQRLVAIRVLSPAPRGGHAVISHTSKLAKGNLAAALVRRLDAGLPVADVDDIAQAWVDCGGVECRATSDHGGTAAVHLDLHTG